LPPLAHQGGWDEILLVVTPLAIIGLLLWLANRRISAQIEATQAGSGASPEVQAAANGDSQSVDSVPAGPAPANGDDGDG